MGESADPCLCGWYVSGKIVPNLFGVWSWIKGQLKYICVKCCKSGQQNVGTSINNIRCESEHLGVNEMIAKHKYC